MATMSFRFRSSAYRGDAPGIPAARPYPLLLWFGMASAVAILFVLLSVTAFLSRFVEQASLRHDANVMAQILNSIVEVEASRGYFHANGTDDKGDFVEFLAHLGSLPGVLRTNVYGVGHQVLWSTDPQLIGKTFRDNDELDRAFAGELVYKTGTIGGADGKAEHALLGAQGARFVENYLPVWADAPRDRKVIGVIEVYRTPVTLWRTIDENQQRVRWGGVIVAVLLYALLFVIVARASCVIARQRAALVATERLAVAGEMASAVAHGLRNPLASIRSTAELGLESEPRPEMREILSEVVAQADRLEGWIRQFLSTARESPSASAPVDVRGVVQACLAHFRSAMVRSGTSVVTILPDDLPKVRCHPVILQQVVNSVLANAIEAMPQGGPLRIEAQARSGMVGIAIVDAGPGMSPDEVEAALSPFATTKPAGLGLGLPLAREMLERHGGRLEIDSRPGHGTRVELIVPAAPAMAEESAAA